MLTHNSQPNRFPDDHRESFVKRELPDGSTAWETQRKLTIKETTDERLDQLFALPTTAETWTAESIKCVVGSSAFFRLSDVGMTYAPKETSVIGSLVVVPLIALFVYRWKAGDKLGVLWRLVFIGIGSLV